MAWEEFEELKFRTVFSLSQLALYFNSMEQQISRLKAEKTAEIQLLIDQGRVPKDLLQSYNSEFERTILRSFRYSYVVLLYLALESKLEVICDHVQVRRNLPLRARDLRGDGLTLRSILKESG